MATRRVYDLTIYFKDSATPLYIDNIWHINTEGELLRLIIDGKSQWWPLCNVFNIRERDHREVPIETNK